MLFFQDGSSLGPKTIMATTVSCFANDNNYHYPVGSTGGNLTWKRLKPIELCKLSKCFFSFDRHLIRRLHRKYIFEREPENGYWIPQKMNTMNIVMRLSLSLSRDYEETLNWEQAIDTIQRYKTNSISYSLLSISGIDLTFIFQMDETSLCNDSVHRLSRALLRVHAFRSSCCTSFFSTL